MANNSGVQNVNMFKTQSPYEQQIEELKRRQQMAEMLQQQALQPLESQVAPGGMVVPTSPVLGLTKMLQAYMGGKQLRDIEKKRGELSERSTAEAQDFLSSLAPGAQQRMSPDAALAASLSAAPTEAQPVTAQQRQQAIMGAGLSANPQMRMAAQLAASMKPERNMKIADLNPKDFTPESWKTASQADDPSLLVGVALKPDKLPETKLSQLMRERAALVAADKTNPSIKAYDAAIEKETQNAPSVNVTYGGLTAGVDAQGNPVFAQANTKGGPPNIVTNVRPEAKPLNEGQANAAGFAKRLEMANEVINSSPFKPSIGGELKAAMPFSNAFLSDAQQQFEQAKREFITAQLRRESGASISPSEFATAEKQYFPQPNEGEESRKQKARSRALAIENMRGAAGSRQTAAPAWQPSPDLQTLINQYVPQGGR